MSVIMFLLTMLVFLFHGKMMEFYFVRAQPCVIFLVIHVLGLISFVPRSVLRFCVHFYMYI